MRYFAILIMAAFFSFAGTFVSEKSPLGLHPAYAEEAWKMQFDDICEHTVDSMNLSDAELKALIERAEKLMPSIDNLEEPQRKLYQRRLKQCKELFIFVLESRKKQ